MGDNVHVPVDGKFLGFKGIGVHHEHEAGFSRILANLCEIIGADNRQVPVPVGRQNLAHPQIQQLGDGAVFESSDKILPWFCCSGTSSDGLLLRSVPARTSSSKTLPCVSNCWLSTPNNLGGDSLPYTSCSGSDCEDSGHNGRSLSSWLHPEPLPAGMAPAFGCIGNGSPELDRPEAEELSAKRFVR